MSNHPLDPRDEHNRQLEGNVHPPGWENPTPAGRYNLVVLGAGTAGLVTAAGAASLGAKVALIEEALMGGDCLNVGCVPSKSLLSSARAAAARRTPEQDAPSKEDFGAAMERMRAVRARLSAHDSAERFQKLGVDVYFGRGRFTGPDAVEVGGRHLRFAKAVIATGARPSAPPIPGLSDTGYLTNETVFSLTERPAHLGIIGAGPIGCEMAQAFARLGSRVTLVEGAHGILPKDDPQASATVLEALRRDGVELRCCSRDLAVEGGPEGIRLRGESHDSPLDVEVDRLLVAAGRAANVEDLGLEAAGVACGQDGVEVDDRLQTSNRRIFAAGDVCSQHRFTHAADAMARLVVRNALFMGRAKASGMTVPWCTYTAPELAQVGLGASGAAQARGRVHTITVALAQVDRPVLDGQDKGFLRIHLRGGTDRILGATVVSANAGNIIATLCTAMNRGIGLKKLAEDIYPYPTEAEAIKRAADQYNRTRLGPVVSTIFERWLAWTR